MSGSAVIMMLIAMLAIWGALAAALFNLRRSDNTSKGKGRHAAS